ncbi:hypothetical protein BASA61_003608 [Batrachochytrium salamandrivorans]|nr:hypothetical protein BASA61_003608 [Batrachochytrium salamandrivorans]
MHDMLDIDRAGKIPSHPPVGSDHTPLCLAATAEFPLAGMYAGETLLSLPMKMAGMGRAFRAEGLSGSTNRGLYRVHQFTKVELLLLLVPRKAWIYSKHSLIFSVIYSKVLRSASGAPTFVLHYYIIILRILFLF